ncbi:hypothetical protein ACWCPM_21955, partial [Streptomyces sp. NPDC002309]
SPSGPAATVRPRCHRPAPVGPPAPRARTPARSDPGVAARTPRTRAYTPAPTLRPAQPPTVPR